MYPLQGIIDGGANLDFVETTEQNHGRIEVRRCGALLEADSVNLRFIFQAGHVMLGSLLKLASLRWRKFFSP